MTENKRSGLTSFLKNLFLKNVAVKIVALVFALLLWGYVLTDQKPVRVKTIPNVTTSFDGEAELLAQSLCVRGNRVEILKNVTVAVSAQITNYASLTANSLNATISLKNISEPREYTLPVSVSIPSSLGTVRSISPATVTLEIDTMRSKTIPVRTRITGQVPEGYWADVDAMSATANLSISGAQTDIARVIRAECVVSLDSYTSTIFRTYDVILYDSDDAVVSNDIIVGTIPSSTVRIPIYPSRLIPIDVAGSLIGTDNLAANHELVAAVATPDEIRIVGDVAAVEEVESIELEPINLGGRKESASIEAEIIVPEGIRVLNADEPVTVSLDIRESTMEQSFDQMPVEVRYLAEGFAASLDISAVNLMVDGRYSLVSTLKRSDIQVFVDVTGLMEGTYELPITLVVDNEEKTVELNTTLSANTVKVTIVAV